VRVQHGPATVTGERIPTAKPLLLAEREGWGARKDPEVRILERCPLIADWGEDPEKELLRVDERNLLQSSISLGEMPWWSWLALGLLLVVLFLVLSASGGLLAPLIGKAAYAADYLHEFAHDGRHLLSIPCH
jgi:hypothetical protein